MKNKQILMLVFIAFIAACTKEEDTSPTNVDDRDKFVGTWLCNEGSGTPFSIEISKLNGTEISIKNFSNYGNHANAIAEVTANTLTISAQDFNDLPGTQLIVSGGSGIYSKTGTQEKIKMSYTVDSTTFTNVLCTR